MLLMKKIVLQVKHKKFSDVTIMLLRTFFFFFFNLVFFQIGLEIFCCILLVEIVI